MLDDILSYARIGFATHLLYECSKLPIGDKWSTVAVATEDDLRRDYKKGDNCGVRLGEPSKIEGMYLHAIDLDIRDDAFRAEAVAALIKLFPKKLLQRMPTVMSGSGGASRHYYFLAEEPLHSRKLAHSKEFDRVWDKRKRGYVKKWKWEIELFGTGKQTVLPPSIHPTTGKPYKWLIEIDMELGIPAVPMEILRPFVRDSIERRKGGKEPVDLTLEQAAEYLDEVDHLVDDRETWTKASMGLHYDFGEDARPIWDAWSQKSENYNKAKNDRQWESYKGDHEDPITFASVIDEAHRMATVQDYVEADEEDDDDDDDDDDDGPPRKKVERRKVVDADEDDEQVGRSKVVDGVEIDKRTGSPKHLLRMPGKLQLFVDLFNQTAPKDQPQFAVQNALALGSSVLARLYRTNNNNYTMLYLVTLGISGAGKEHGKTLLERVVDEADLSDEIMGPSEYTSNAGVLSRLMMQPRHMLIIDEFGKYQQSVRKGGDKNAEDVRRSLLGIWGRAGGVERGKAYSTHTMSKEQIDAMMARKIIRPSITIMGMSTPEVFYDSIDLTDVREGWLNRMIIVESKIGPQKRKKMRDRPTPKELIKWIRWYSLPRDPDDDDAMDYVQPPHPVDVMDPVVIPFTEGAEDVFDKMEDVCMAEADRVRGHRMDEMFQRGLEMAMRVSLILALSCEEDEISAENAEWARDYVLFYLRQNVDRLMELLGSSELVKIANLMADDVYNAGKKGLTEREFGRKHTTLYNNLSTKDSDEVKRLLLRNHGVAPSKTSRNKRGRSTYPFVHPKFLKDDDDDD